MKNAILNAIPRHDLKQAELEFLALNLMLSSVLVAVFFMISAMPDKTIKPYRSINPVEYYQGQ